MFLSRLELTERNSPDIWAVAAPLVWADWGRRVVVPVGFKTDLASIPRILRNIPNLDINGLSRSPAVLHDWLYRTHETGSRAKADRLFREALRSRGVGKWSAWVFWAGVRIGGRGPWNKSPYGPKPYDFASPGTYQDWRRVAQPNKALL